MKRIVLGILLSMILLCFNGCGTSNVLVPDKIAVSRYERNVPRTVTEKKQERVIRSNKD